MSDHRQFVKCLHNVMLEEPPHQHANIYFLADIYLVLKTSLNAQKDVTLAEIQVTRA